MKIIKLRCKKCGNTLSGATNDYVFVCTDCSTAYVFGMKLKHPLFNEGLDEESPLTTPMEYFNGKNIYDYKTIDFKENALGEYLVLPFWFFLVRPSFEADSEKKTRLYKTLEKETQVLIPAFSYNGSLYAGWPGEDLDINIEKELQDETPPISGAVRDPFSAFVIGWYLIFRKADKIADVSNAKMSIEHIDTKFLGVCSKIVDDKIFFPFSQKGYPVVYFPNIKVNLNLKDR